MLRGLFVTGTDTGVGKTVVSAALLHRYQARVPLQYWKPIQTGAVLDDDTTEVRRLAGVTGARIHEPGVRFPDPVSPHLAAKLAGQTIELGPLMAHTGDYPDTERWIVEGAGGVSVPINASEMMTDLMTALGLPVVVVTRSALGTINHTLLTLECLRARSLAVAGVVMVGKVNRYNRSAIEDYGRIAVLAEMPTLVPLSPSALATWVERELDPNAELWEWLQ